VQLHFDKLNLPAEQALLIHFLTDEKWPFHSGLYEPEKLAKSIASGAFANDDCQTFWIRDAAQAELGLLKLFDLEDIGSGAPLFDLRLRASARGQGIGQQAVMWLTRYLFETWPILNRIEGTTRVDNRAMRRVFLKCGYAKEGHYRQAWPGQNTLHDAIHYGILRQDWEKGIVTPVNWLDEIDA
jgi:RimJ/RimL family protein N-acetyltransferase